MADHTLQYATFLLQILCASNQSLAGLAHALPFRFGGMNTTFAFGFRRAVLWERYNLQHRQSKQITETETQKVVSRHEILMESFAAEVLPQNSVENFQVFRVLEESRDELHLHEYGVSQTLAVAGCGFLFLSFHVFSQFFIIFHHHL